LPIFSLPPSRKQGMCEVKGGSKWRARVVGQAAVEAARVEWLLLACSATRVCITQETYLGWACIISGPELCTKHADTQLSCLASPFYPS
jgi:hypothetical protein